MIQNFRLLNQKDTESSSQTVILSMGLNNSIIGSHLNDSVSVTKQQELNDNFDNFIEKRK